MKWKRAISALLAFVMVLSMALQAVPAAEAAAVYSVKAPTADLKIEFWLDDAGKPWYQVVRNGVELIEDSALGLKTSLGDLNSGLSLSGEPVSDSGDETWEPLVGEHAEIRDCWNETAFPLVHSSTGLEFTIVMRAYDEGVAFRYILPENEGSYTVSDEYTQFKFQAGATATLHLSNNQTVPYQYKVEKLPAQTIQRPATVEFADGQCLTVCEGDLENYAVMIMTGVASTRTLEANLYSTVTVTDSDPAESPWRVLVMGDEPTDLLENDTIVQNLNEPADEGTYNFSEWLEPGTCVRATRGLNNDAIKTVIDIASQHGIRYVLLDSGWYGPEYDANADPRLDPAALDPENEKDKILLEKYFATEGGYNNTGEGVFNTRGVGFNQYGSLGDGGSVQVNVDIPALCAYGKEKNVGIILYVNKVFLPDSSGRNRFTVDELFAYYEKWGVAGVKPGFVNVRTQQYEAYMEEVIQAAAKHKLVMTVHDEYVTTGQERTYPNLMMTEGILGDEGIGRNSPQVAEDIATIFTRNVQGPPDHTFCYPGKATKAYALASPILYRSGMSVLYWYTDPNAAPDEGLLNIWDNMPTSWDESLFLEGSLYEYATTARRAGEKWYVGSLSAVTRTLELPLDFLDEGVSYVAEIYADGTDADPYAGWTTSKTAAKSKQTLDISRVIVDSETVLQRELEYGFGYAVMLTPATEEDLAALDEYSVSRQELKLEIQRSASVAAGNYTSDSYAAFQVALAQAEEILADAAAEETALASALAELKAARLALVAPGALQDAIAQTAYYTSYHFTEETYSVLAQAVADGQALLDSGSYTQEDLDKAESAIVEALAGLADDPDRVLKKTVYLDELSYDTSRSYAHANAIKPKTDYYGSTLSLMVDGKEQIFERGLMTHAQAEVFYNIEGMDLQIFQGYVGVDTVKSSQGNVIFKIFGDGVLLYESAPSGTGSQNAQHFSIPIAGVKELHIEANMNESNDGDHAVWADAKFLSYRDPNAFLDGITVNGEAIPGFSQDTLEYIVYAPDAGTVPQVDAIPAEGDVAYTVKQATSVPGCAQVQVEKLNGEVETYRIYLLQTEDSDYLSDLPNSLIVENTLYGMTKDVAQGGLKLALTAADGASAIYYTKGIGTHAKTGTTSRIVYNIEGRGYDRFSAYVGISYLKNDSRSTVNFKVYVDDETTPRFESGKMGYRDPAIYCNVDISGAKKLILVADACGDQSADHGCWCDAKFLKYTGIQIVSGTVDVGVTGLAPAGIPVELYDAAGELVKTALTGENGAYIFENVLAGSYELRIAEGENHFAAAAQITVSSAPVVQALRLSAPKYTIDILQPKDAIVFASRSTASRDEQVMIYVRNIPAGKTVSAVTVTGETGSVAVSELDGDYAFAMPKCDVTIQVTLADDTGYAEAAQDAKEMDAKIQALGQVTLAKKDQVEALRAEYEALSDAAKAQVTKLDLLEYYEQLLVALDVQSQVDAAAQASAEALAAAEAAAQAAGEESEAAQAAAAVAEMAKDAAAAAAEAAKASDGNAAASAASAAQAAAQAAESYASAADAAAKAEAAQAAAEKAAASAAEDKTAADKAAAAAEAAQAAAENAMDQADEAAAAAEESAAAAARSDAAAAASAAESAAASASAAQAASDAAGSAASATEAAGQAQAAQAAAESAQAAAEEAAASAAEDKTAADKAAAAAETAQAAAEAAAAESEKAMNNAAAAEEAAAAAAQAAAESNAAAAEEAAKAAADAANAAGSAEEAAGSAQAAAASAAASASAAAQAQAAEEAAEEAQTKAEAAQAAAEEAAASAAEDMTAAATAAQAAELAQARAEAAQTAAAAAQAAADSAAAAAEDSNVAAAEAAARSAASATFSATGAAASAEAAAAAAESAALAQSAKADAEAAAKRAEEDREAADAALAEALRAEEEARKAAAEAELNLSKYNALAALDKLLPELLEEVTGDNRAALEESAEAARETINAAATEEEVAEVLAQTRDELSTLAGRLCASEEFTDVKRNVWYHDAVDFVLNEGMMSGYGEGCFAPEDSLSRAMLVQILYNIQGRPEFTTDKSFTDVAEGDWYYSAVLWAAEEGIVLGRTDGTYDPTAPVTREQMVTILYRYAGSPETEAELGFADKELVEEWAVKAVAWAAENGIVQGMGMNLFNPDGNTTRAQTAQVMMNYFA